MNIVVLSLIDKAKIAFTVSQLELHNVMAMVPLAYCYCIKKIHRPSANNYAHTEEHSIMKKCSCYRWCYLKIVEFAQNVDMIWYTT